MDQINDGRVIRAERLEKSVGFAVVLRRDDGNADAEKSWLTGETPVR